MQKFEKIVEDLSQVIKEEVSSSKLSRDMLRKIERMVKEVTKLEFRMNRTLREKKISNAVLNNTINELEKQNKIIEKQSKFKEELFASISHELRTPLHGILGMSHLIARTEMSEKQSEFINVIKGSADNLLVIINDILNLTQMNAGKAEIINVPFCLGDVIAELEGGIKVQAEKKNLFLRIEVSPEVPKVIVGDRTRIYQVLINLLNNSIKFTEKGWVLLKIEALESWGDEVDLMITVEDTGMGIKKEQQDKIFLPFSRVHDSEGGIIEGAGLGLNIVKKLMRLLDGKISVKSEYGKGTCFKLRFTFKIPENANVEVDHQPADHLEIPAAWEQLDILLIEDNAANILYAKHLFREWNMDIDIAEDCATSRKKLKNKKYDCILSDVKLPDGNGIDLIRDVRKNFNSPNYQTPVIVLTANASEHEKIVTEAINIQSYISKPFRPISLIKEMKMAIENHQKIENSASYSVPKTPVPTDKPVYFAFLYKTFGNNLSVVREMLEIFKAQIPVTLEKLEKHIQEKNYQGFYFEIHRIKSTINIVGLPVLFELAMIMERDSHDASDVSMLAENFDKFKKQAVEDSQIIEAELERLSEPVD